MRKRTSHGELSRNSLVDLLRFLMAFLVVAIHIHFPLHVSLVLLPLTRTAVPFFFMVSGFFLADADPGKMRQRLNRQIRHIFWLLAGAMAAYLCFKLVLSAHDGTFTKTAAALWDWNRWFRLIAVNATGEFYAGPLWYLSALLYAMVILRLALEYHPVARLYWTIGLLAFIVPLILWQRAAGEPLPLVRNFITVGLPCVMAGVLLKRGQARILKLPRALVIAMPIACTGLIYLERLLFLRVYGYANLTFFYSALLLAASLIVLSQHFPHWGARTPLPAWGAKYSLMIYIVHSMVITLQGRAAAALGIRKAAWYETIAPVLVFLFSFAFAALWEFSTRRAHVALAIKKQKINDEV